MTIAALVEAAPATLVRLPAAPGHRVSVLEAVAAAFTAMKKAAAGDGIELLPVSGFRDVARQTAIWNRKVEAKGLAHALEYSAPPGWSRHHWGSDLDLVGGALASEPRLAPGDWEGVGPCASDLAWLAEHALDYGFVRPYDIDRGGFKPEPWHWSFLPMARPRLSALDRVDWRPWLATSPYLGARDVLAALDELYPRFARGIAPALLS